MQIKWNTYMPPEKKAAIYPMRSSITHHGELTVNYTAWRAMGEPEAVHLLFDPGNALIGLKPVHPSTPHAKVLRQRKDRTLSFWLPVREFCNYYGLDWRPGIKFQRFEVHDDGMLVLYLYPSTKFYRRTEAVT